MSKHIIRNMHRLENEVVRLESWIEHSNKQGLLGCEGEYLEKILQGKLKELAQLRYCLVISKPH